MTLGRETRSGQTNARSSAVARPSTTSENPRATARAALSDDVRYVKTAPTAGNMTTKVKIGKSSSISQAPEPRQRELRIGVDHPKERQREEPDEEDERHEDTVRHAFPREQVVRLAQFLRHVSEQYALHRVDVIHGRDDNRDERGEDQ